MSYFLVWPHRPSLPSISRAKTVFNRLFVHSRHRIIHSKPGASGYRRAAVTCSAVDASAWTRHLATSRPPAPVGRGAQTPERCARVLGTLRAGQLREEFARLSSPRSPWNLGRCTCESPRGRQRPAATSEQASLLVATPDLVVRNGPTGRKLLKAAFHLSEEYSRSMTSSIEASGGSC